MQSFTVTFIVADYAPFIILQEPVRHRSVHIELTQEQIEKIGLKQSGTDCGKPIIETISKCFVENKEG
jgi:hypothetical protein